MEVSIVWMAGVVWILLKVAVSVMRAARASCWFLRVWFWSWVCSRA